MALFYSWKAKLYIFVSHINDSLNYAPCSDTPIIPKAMLAYCACPYFRTQGNLCMKDQLSQAFLNRKCLMVTPKQNQSNSTKSAPAIPSLLVRRFFVCFVCLVYCVNCSIIIHKVNIVTVSKDHKLSTPSSVSTWVKWLASRISIYTHEDSAHGSMNTMLVFQWTLLSINGIHN